MEQTHAFFCGWCPNHRITYDNIYFKQKIYSGIKIKNKAIMILMFSHLNNYSDDNSMHVRVSWARLGLNESRNTAMTLSNIRNTLSKYLTCCFPGAPNLGLFNWHALHCVSTNIDRINSYKVMMITDTARFTFMR